MTNAQPTSGSTDPEVGQRHRDWCAFEDNDACRDEQTGRLECCGDDYQVQPSRQRAGRPQRPISLYLQDDADRVTTVAIEPAGGPIAWELTPAEAVQLGFYLLSNGLEAQGEPMSLVRIDGR